MALYGQENNGSTWALAVMNMFLHGFDNASIRWGDTIRNPRHTESPTSLKKFDVVVANPPFSLKNGEKKKPKPMRLIVFGEECRLQVVVIGRLYCT